MINIEDKLRFQEAYKRIFNDPEMDACKNQTEKDALKLRRTIDNAAYRIKRSIELTRRRGWLRSWFW